MYNVLSTFGEGATPIIDTSALEDALTLDKFGDVIEAVLPIVAVAVLVGFIFYLIRWTIGLFRGV